MTELAGRVSASASEASPASLARRPWDVVVVGAGPAGAFAARELARRRLRVLLVDRARFPRAKVCGDCLNGRALGALDRAGLSDLVDRLGGVPLGRFEVRTPGASAELDLPRGAAVSRRAFDAALAEAAVEAGAEFVDGARAQLGAAKGAVRRVTLELRSRGATPSGAGMGSGEAARGETSPAASPRRIEVEARLVLAADGLAGSLLPAGERRRARVARSSRIGVGAVCAEPPAGYRRGVIQMAVGRRGYAGLVVIEDGRLNVAAALDPAWVHELGGPGAAVAEILAAAGYPPLGELDWHGTPPLTRRAARPAMERVLLLGDAAAYVEPFTGEGIGWALSAAAAVAPYAERAVERAARRWRPELALGWRRELRRIHGRDRLACRLLAHGLRRPRLAKMTIRALAARPTFARPFVERLNALPARARR